MVPAEKREHLSPAEFDAAVRRIRDANRQQDAGNPADPAADNRESPPPASPPDKSSRGEARMAELLDLVRPDRDGSGNALRSFEPTRAGLPDLSTTDAKKYLDAVDRSRRPWLASADHAGNDTQRIIAAVDRGEGHFLQRHEGHAAGERGRARVELLQDPANADEASRKAADDAYKIDPAGRPQRHVCGADSTCIKDPELFARAVERVARHPHVRSVLDHDYDPQYRPTPVKMPIADILGKDGHEHCEGYRLSAIDGSVGKAQQNRAEWVKAHREGRTTEAIEPTSEKIESFEGGSLMCMFTAKNDRSGYTVLTLFPRPAQPDEE